MHESTSTASALPTEGLQVVVELPGNESRRKNQLDIETEIKRKLNKIKRERQLDLHKTNILCWIAHMNSVNLTLNDMNLMAEINKLIPGQQCYPKDKTDISYFEQISKWYKNLIVIKEDEVYPGIKNRPPLDQSLLLQIKSKTAICKRDYVFIFVILARSIGLQCRIVMNLVTAPIRPLMTDLCRISEKKDESKSSTNDSKSSKTSKKTTKSTNAKKLKIECGGSSAVKIPQMDGNDDDPSILTRKRMTRGRALQSKTNIIPEKTNGKIYT